MMTRSTFKLLALVIVLVCCIGVACRKGPGSSDTSPGTIQPVPEARDESGWPYYEVAADGFGLSLPPDWRQVDMNPATFESKAQELTRQNPDLAPMFTGLRGQLATGVKFFGFDLRTKRNGFATNVNVLRYALPAGSRSLDAATAASLAQLEAIPGIAKPVSHERIKVPNGERERFRSKLTMSSPAGASVTTAMTQYLLVRGEDGYVVTLVTTAEEADQRFATFERIGRSFRFTR
jgi:hypothetical protein